MRVHSDDKGGDCGGRTATRVLRQNPCVFLSDGDWQRCPSGVSSAAHNRTGIDLQAFDRARMACRLPKCTTVSCASGEVMLITSDAGAPSERWRRRGWLCVALVAPVDICVAAANALAAIGRCSRVVETNLRNSVLFVGDCGI